jgi:uncharacterized protein YjiK
MVVQTGKYRIQSQKVVLINHKHINFKRTKSFFGSLFSGVKLLVERSAQLFYIFLFLATIAGCSRDNPEIVSGNDDIPKIYPLSVHQLNIPEPSGITYNFKNNSLMIVSDGRTDIYETNFTGEILRTIPGTGSDMEGIALSRTCDTIFVVEERKKMVTAFDINGNKLNSFSVNVATNDNSALEGIALFSSDEGLLVVNEKDPQMILLYRNQSEIWRKTIAHCSDISDIFYDVISNNIWLISDESKKVLKLSVSCELLEEWEIPFTKGEGITIVDDKMYIVNDSDAKLYVFQKTN